MTNSTMTKYDFTKVISHYNSTLLDAQLKYINEDNAGGKVRGTVGKLYEQIATMICLLVDNNLVIKHNDYKREYSPCGEYFNDSQVDLHVYLRDELILIIECKTYLDKSMLIRAVDEFKNIRKHHAITSDKVLPCAIFTGQFDVNKNTFGFFNSTNSFDTFVVNSTRKRNSKLPLHKTLDPLDVNRLQQFADYVYNIVNNS